MQIFATFVTFAATYTTPLSVTQPLALSPEPAFKTFRTTGCVQTVASKRLTLRHRAKLPPMSDLVCHCFQVTETELLEILAKHPCKSIMELQDHTHAGRGCGCCVFDLDDLIAASKQTAPKTEHD